LVLLVLTLFGFQLPRFLQMSKVTPSKRVVVVLFCRLFYIAGNVSYMKRSV
jgi:hypothetical protein